MENGFKKKIQKCRLKNSYTAKTGNWKRHQNNTAIGVDYNYNNNFYIDFHLKRPTFFFLQKSNKKLAFPSCRGSDPTPLSGMPIEEYKFLFDVLQRLTEAPKGRSWLTY